ncbi:MAG: endo-1,4-beta-xylanase [Fibrobacterota bacterium]|nr:endo-1,4-beta-xylanase [Fibrobacterota bacterium]QQS06237.1 MAG: endo-1,4-beta-xylanase [Fibrobacterota bacterium]
MKHPSHLGGRLCVLAVALSTAAASAQLAKGQCKFLGNIITNSVPSDYNTYWNQASPENSGKWSSIQSSVKSTSYNWSGFDVVYKWGQTTGNPVKFHTLVWGSQQPSDASSATLADIKKWFEAVHTRYPDVAQIDVVNEAYSSHAPAQYRNALKNAASQYGVQSGEYDWIFVAFKMARELWKDPAKTELIYNDFNTIEYDGENNWQVNMAKAAKAQKIPIDAIGLQAHDAYKLSTSSVKAKIDKIAAEGIPLYVTEYDIGETDNTKQKNIMAEQMTMFWNHPNIKGVTYWGLRDGQTWRTGTGIFTSGGQPRPSMTWLIDWIPKNQAKCLSDIEARPAVATTPKPSGLIMKNIDGRLVAGVEREGKFVAVSALGKN